ncbi:hypothetical protein L210DRAFT_2107262 [Boletus edulis BED1]|uniref:Uncharacterized protein n=1 Tax=Boletus edulis BED1 TaxID=1328754 RepID=A0AAD4G766_BOLED|nr:hypothetical protein L210DRAFT_2107262 [Boletus edulis BED1]
MLGTIAATSPSPLLRPCIGQCRTYGHARQRRLGCLVVVSSCLFSILASLSGINLIRWSGPTPRHWVGNVPPPCRAHTATLVDRKIVIFGSGQASTVLLDDVWCLNLVHS